jgi:hypothetical protein
VTSLWIIKKSFGKQKKGVFVTRYENMNCDPKVGHNNK